MRRHKPSDPRGAKTALVVLLGIMAVLAIAVMWRYLSAPATQPSFDEGQKLSEQFLAQLRGGQIDAAYGSTTTEFKNAQGRDKFAKYVRERKYLKAPARFVSVQTVTIGDTPRAEYNFRGAEGGQTIRLLAGHENGAWRIDRFVAE